MNKLTVRIDASYDIEEIQPFAAQQFFRIVIHCVDAQFVREGFGLGASPIIEGHALDPFQFFPGGELVMGPKPGAKGREK